MGTIYVADLGCDCDLFVIKREVIFGNYVSSYFFDSLFKRPTIFLYMPRVYQLLNRNQYTPENVKEQKMERVVGIEPTRTGWQPARLPLHHTRVTMYLL